MAGIRKRPDCVWRARCRDEADKEHSRRFTRKVDAQGWIDKTTARIVTGCDTAARFFAPAAVNVLGRPLRHRRWKPLWKAASDKARVEASAHTLRHFHASELVAGGASIRQVQTERPQSSMRRSSTRRRPRGSTGSSLDAWSHWGCELLAERSCPQQAGLSTDAWSNPGVVRTGFVRLLSILRGRATDVQH